MPDGELRGRVALVTGGSGGIGSAICAALQRAGATAISLDLAQPKDKAPWIACDIRSDDAVRSAVERAAADHHRLDILVHAAGVSRDAVLWKATVEDWDFIQSVNLRGAFLLLRHGIPHLRAVGAGRIVLIGSINGSRGKFGTAAYSASKAGLLGLMKTAAREVGRFGILVNVVEPGWVRTPLTDAVPQEVRDAAVKESLLGVLLDPSDIANAVLYLSSEGGRRITGQILRVDGGQQIG